MDFLIGKLGFAHNAFSRTAETPVIGLKGTIVELLFLIISF
jgi:hypothetical protein